MMFADFIPLPYSAEMLRRSGIYHILHVASGREYIGSAKSFHHRWQEHRDTLRHHRHRNKRLEHSWHAHGETAFEFHILEFVDDLTQLTVREQWYLDTYQPYYNENPTAGSMLGYRHRIQSRQKMRESALEQRQNPSESQLDYYGRLRIETPPGIARWHARQRGLPKRQPLTEKQRAALRLGAKSLEGIPLTGERLEAIRRNQLKGAAKRRGSTNSSSHRKKISDSCKEAFAAHPPEKQEAIRAQARTNQAANAKRKHEKGLANQQLVWEVLEARGWIPNVPMSSWSAANIIKESVTHLSQSRISEFLRWWEAEGKLKLRTSSHPLAAPPPFLPPSRVTQGILFPDDPEEV